MVSCVKGCGLILVFFLVFLLTTRNVYADYNQCTDNIDNDMDGLIDANDPGCASGTEEFNVAVPPSAGALKAGGLLWYPVPIVGSSILTNPGFEQLGSGGKPLNWTLTAWNALDSTIAHSGVNSLRSTGPAGGNSASQSVYVRPGLYRVSAWVKAQNLSGNPSLVLGFWPWTHVRGGISITSGTYDWTYLEKRNVVVSGNSSYTGSVEKFGLNGLPSGTFWVDDIELKREFIPIEIFMLYPNFHGFLFDDKPQTMKFDVVVDPASGQLSDYRVDALVTTESGATVLSQSFPAQAHFNATLDGSSLSVGQTYLVRFKLVRISDNAVLFEYPAYRISKVSGAARSQMAISYDENNRILIKGQPSFLLGVYDSHTSYFFGVSAWENYLTKLRKLFEMPINIYNNYWMNGVPTPQLADAVAALYKNGIYYLHTGNCAGSVWGMPSFPIYTNDTYLTIVSSWPNTVGFYTMDECSHEFAPAILEKEQRLANFKPDGITFGATYDIGTLHVWRDGINLLSTDPYPIGDGNAKITRTADWTIATREAVKNSRPIATVPQLLKIGGVFPNYEQLRSMSYMAITEGANGLIYWSVGSGTGALGAVCSGWCDEKLLYFSCFKSVLMELKNLEPALISVDRPDLLLANSNPAIHTRVKTADGKGFIVAYNYKDTTETTTFTWSQPPLRVFVNNESREISAAGNTFSDTFQPYVAHVYVISTSTNEPPFILNGGPGGTLPWDTIQTTLSVVTDKTATCRYANVSGLPYDSIPYSLSTADGVHHSATVSLVTNRVYKYYVRCASAGLKNSGDYMILFVVDAKPPVISNISATIVPAGVFVNWTTNEQTDGQVEFGPTTSYGNSSISDGAQITSHKFGLGYVPPGVPYHYRVRSRNAQGALAISDDNVLVAQPVPFATIRVKSGVPDDYYTDSQHNIWIPDVGYVGGTNYWYYVSVNGTADSSLYITWRHSKSSFSYVFTVPNGDYAVKLKFAEMYNTAVGQNVFNVIANGQTAISNLDIVAQAGIRTAYDRQIGVSVTNGRLELQFVTVTGDAKVNAIEITQGNVSIDTTPPTVSITKPSNGTTLSGITEIAATASDDVGVYDVQFAVDGHIIGSDSTPPYNIQWDTSTVGAGLHTIMAIAHDTSFNPANSSSVVVNVTVNCTDECAAGQKRCYNGNYSQICGNYDADSCTEWGGDLLCQYGCESGQCKAQPFAPPVISNVNAVPGRTTAVISWTTDVQSNSSVNYGTSVSIGMAATDAAMVTSHYISLSNLSETTVYYYSVRSCTATGNCNTSSVYNFTTTSTPDTSIPTVLITSPSDGVNVNGIVNITANATDNVGVAYVEFYRDGTLLGTDYSSPYSYSWNTASESNGQHNLTARAVDTSNNYATNAITVNVNNAPSGPSGPSGPVTPPADKTPPTTPANLLVTAVSSSSVNLTWSNSTDNVGVMGYKIYRNGVQIATSKINSYFDTGLSPETTYKYNVLAYDASDNPSNQSLPVSVMTLAVETPPAEIGGQEGETGQPSHANDGGNVTKQIGLFEGVAAAALNYPAQYAVFFVVFVVIIMSLLMLYFHRNKKRKEEKKKEETSRERPSEEKPGQPADMPRFFVL